MPSTRSQASDLLRLFADVSVPLYLLDEQRRIVYLNPSAAQWLRVEPGDLVGRQCNYCSGNSDLTAALADALCPPPEVFHGQETSAQIVNPAATTDPARQRSAHFILLPGGAEQIAGVLVLIEAEARSASAHNGRGKLELGAGHHVADSHSEDSGSESRQLHELIIQFRRQMAQEYHLNRLAGVSPAMSRVREQIKLAACSGGTVLIVGPQGIGRERVARSIHTLAAWRNSQSAAPAAVLPTTSSAISSQQNHATGHVPGGFVTVSCSDLPPEVLCSTLGALSERRGGDSLQSASSPAPQTTVLLADVHQLPATVHSDVLRWLAALPGNLRVISTSAELPAELARRSDFSAELRQLLSTLVIELPPLTDRREDIPLLAQMFLEDLNSEGGRQLRGFKPEALDRLALYDWPGQADELAILVREVFARAEGFEITPADLPDRLRLADEAARFPRPVTESIDLEAFLARVERELIDRALHEAKGNKSRAARLLGMTRPRLYRRMVQLGLEPGED